MKNKNYRFQLVKKRKAGICKNCEKPIEVNTNAYIVSLIEDDIFTPTTIIAIIHEKCKNKVDFDNTYSFMSETYTHKN
jgi:RNase P subunit RPR2